MPAIGTTPSAMPPPRPAPRSAPPPQLTPIRAVNQMSAPARSAPAPQLTPIRAVNQMSSPASTLAKAGEGGRSTNSARLAVALAAKGSGKGGIAPSAAASPAQQQKVESIIKSLGMSVAGGTARSVWDFLQKPSSFQEGSIPYKGPHYPGLPAGAEPYSPKGGIASIGNRMPYDTAPVTNAFQLPNQPLSRTPSSNTQWLRGIRYRSGYPNAEPAYSTPRRV